MHDANRLDRRGFIVAAAAATLGISGCGAQRGVAAAPAPASDRHEITPAEDLMREHGLLERLLLVYEEAMRQQRTPWPAVADTARLVRTFIEDYHERLEEEHLFPRLERAGREVALVATLREQHQRGRALTQRIAGIAGGAPRAEDRQPVAEAVAAFIRMYRPHAAREDTVLFGAVAEIVPPQEYAALGERFEDREHELFGSDGFGRIVAQVAQLERGLGIDDLARFTPS
jgi:hemerythrin-like domain-containing protein